VRVRTMYNAVNSACELLRKQKLKRCPSPTGTTQIDPKLKKATDAQSASSGKGDFICLEIG
jgi:hypothetical protein